MPSTIVKHKSWCREHQSDYAGEHCFAGAEVGPANPPRPEFPDGTGTRGNALDGRLHVVWGALHCQRVRPLAEIHVDGSRS